MAKREKANKLVITEGDLGDDGGNTEGATTVDRTPPPPKKPKLKVRLPDAVTSKLPTPGAGQAARPSGPRPWYSKHSNKLILGGAAVAALIAGFLVTFVALGLFDSNEKRTEEALGDSTSEFEEVLTGIDESTQAELQFTTLRQVAADTDERATAVAENAATLREKVDDGRLANPALEALGAEEDFLTQFATLDDVPVRNLKPRWNALEPRLDRAQRRIETAGAEVAELDLGDPSLTPNDAEIESALRSADGIVVTASRAWDRWFQQAAEIEAEVSNAETYRASMAGLIDDYYGQRNVTQDFVNAVPIRFDDAVDTLSAHAAEREGIIGSMNSLSPPAEAASAHAEMVGLATESKNRLQASAQYAADPSTEIIWSNSFDYQDFVADSDSITSRFGPAEAAVLGAADQAIQHLKSQPRPPKPRV